MLSWEFLHESYQTLIFSLVIMGLKKGLFSIQHGGIFYYSKNYSVEVLLNHDVESLLFIF